MMQDFAEMKGYNGGRKNGRGEGPFGVRTLLEQQRHLKRGIK